MCSPGRVREGGSSRAPHGSDSRGRGLRKLSLDTMRSVGWRGAYARWPLCRPLSLRQGNSSRGGCKSKNDPSDLEDPGEGWISLDRKLAAALANIAYGEIGRQITQATTTASSNTMVARGRVLPAIVFRYYASGDNAQVLCDLSHLQKLVLRGDHLGSCYNTWNMV